MSNIIRQLLCFAVILLVTMFTACSDRSDTLCQPAEELLPAVINDEQNALVNSNTILYDFQQVSAIAKVPSQATSWRTGTDFDDSLPSSKVTTITRVRAKFSPTGEDIENIAYCVYAFSFINIYDTDFCAQMNPDNADRDEDSHVYLGFSNFQENCWDWKEASDDDSVLIADISPYQRQDGLSLVAVVVTGTTELLLDHLGFTSTSFFDEIEPNNTKDEAQLLPAIPVYAFRGSLGASQVNFTGYDGGSVDFFEINASDEDIITVVGLGVTHYFLSCPYIMLEISNSDGVLFSSSNKLITQVITPQFTYSSNKAPYIIEMHGANSEYELYIISGVTGTPPIAILEATPQSGNCPLTVTLDASNSYDENPGGSIVRFDWDYESDGVWDLLNSTVPAVTHTYRTGGVYYPRVRVGNNLGLGGQDANYSTSQGTCTITVGNVPYSEIEDNDGQTPDDYNVLPTIPFSGYTGNVGYSWCTAGPMYDGDWSDNFTFYAEAGTTYSFLDDNFYDGYSYDNGYNPILRISRLDGSYIKGVNGPAKSISFKPSVSGEYHFEIMAQSNSASHDYSLRAFAGSPPTCQQFSASPIRGIAPLNLTLSVTATDPDGDELTYGWADSSQYPEQEFGNNTTANMYFPNPGSQYIHCFITDSTGLRTTQTKYIYVVRHDYEENEQNNASYYSQPLPSLPFTEFRGSLAGAGDGGYDGGTQDWYVLADYFSTGESLFVTVQTDQPEEPCHLQLTDKSGNELATADAIDGVISFEYLCVNSLSQPLHIQLWADTNSQPNIDYTMSASK